MARGDCGVTVPREAENAKEAGWREDRDQDQDEGAEGEEIIADEYDDLSRKADVELEELVKEEYNTDYYILGMFAIRSNHYADTDKH